MRPPMLLIPRLLPSMLLPSMLLIAACSGGGDDPDEPVELAANGAPVVAAPAKPDATGPGTALGLTYLQLEDADLVDATGRELAEVHEIDADRAGTVHGLFVRLKGPPGAGRTVRIALDGLTLVPDGDEWNLRTAATPETLAALPAAPR